MDAVRPLFDATGLKFKNVLESPSFTIAQFLQTSCQYFLFSRSVAQCSSRRVSSLRCSSCTLPNDVAHCKTVSVLALNSRLEKANHCKLLALAPGNHISYLYSTRQLYQEGVESIVVQQCLVVLLRASPRLRTTLFCRIERALLASAVVFRSWTGLKHVGESNMLKQKHCQDRSL